MLAAVSLTGCSTWSQSLGDLAANTGPKPPPPLVVVKNDPIPDIPAAIEKCLTSYPDLKDKGGMSLPANEFLLRLHQDNDAKRGCAAQLLIWHEGVQKGRGKVAAKAADGGQDKDASWR